MKRVGPVSRLLWFWDAARTYDPAAPANPASASRISERRSRRHVVRSQRPDRGLCSGNRPLGELDEEGHDTGCAGIAAGNGQARGLFLKAGGKPVLGADFTPRESSAPAFA